LLVVGTSIDPHIDRVLEHLPRELVVARLDVDMFPRAQRLSLWRLSNDGLLVLENGSGDFDISAPRTGWFRRMGLPGLADNVPTEYRRFCLGEAEQALEGLLSVSSPRFWLNEYWATRRAANKIDQYRRAALCGLRVPETLVTNSVSVATDWLANHPRAIAKSLSSPHILDVPREVGRIAFTHELDVADRESLGGVGTTACQFQPYVDKAYELRVTTVGSRHFTVRIDSQHTPDGRVDWRSVMSTCKYTPDVLPQLVASRLSDLLREIGLGFAASDFIVTPAGEYIFLEANPHGAWLWLEEEIRALSVTGAIAELLASPPTS
jgi:MvdD-like protein with pre-ATP grasp domain